MPRQVPRHYPERFAFETFYAGPASAGPPIPDDAGEIHFRRQAPEERLKSEMPRFTSGLVKNEFYCRTLIRCTAKDGLGGFKLILERSVSHKSSKRRFMRYILFNQVPNAGVPKSGHIRPGANARPELRQQPQSDACRQCSQERWSIYSALPAHIVPA